jgi:precorrin-2 dehydrogenase/sirohydrochlorin ferrochelatase
MRLVFACTNSREVNQEIAEESKTRGLWCSVADDANASNFQGMATIRRGEITVAVSTSGGSPALAKHLKREIEECIGDEYAQLLQLMSESRAQQNRNESTQKERAAMWHRVLESDVLDLLRQGQNERAQSRVREIMNLK